MNILITGGIGLLSTRLANFLSKKNHQIILVSRDKSKINFLKKNNLKIKKINWTSNANIKKLCNNIDCIIHCAGSNNEDSNKKIFENFIFSTYIFHNFLNIAIEKKVKNFLLISTIHIYSAFLKNTIDENTKTKNNKPYPTNKKLSEIILNNAIK